MLTGQPFPWTAPSPVVDAILQRRLVWLGDQEDTARRYPRIGIMAPYHFMLLAAPRTLDDLADTSSTTQSGKPAVTTTSRSHRSAPTENDD